MKTKLTPFGTQPPALEPFGKHPPASTPFGNSHRKSSSPMASPPSKGESYVELEMKLSKHYGTYLKRHLEKEHPRVKGKIKMKGGSKNE